VSFAIAQDLWTVRRAKRSTGPFRFAAHPSRPSQPVRGLAPGLPDGIGSAEPDRRLLNAPQDVSLERATIRASGAVRWIQTPARRWARFAQQSVQKPSPLSGTIPHALTPSSWGVLPTLREPL